MKNRIRVLHVAQAAGGVDRYIRMLFKYMDHDKFENILALRQPGQAVASVINRLTVEPDVFDNKLGIVVIIKNEGPYIEEWVRYHLLVGADIIYIYDNESTDNTRQILEPYISSGKVVYKYFPGIAMQLPAYNDALRRYKNSCKNNALISSIVMGLCVYLVSCFISNIYAELVLEIIVGVVVYVAISLISKNETFCLADK